jgi:hypothetical protein
MKPTPISIDLTKVAPDIFKLISEVIEAVHKNSEGGAKITANEWLEIGQASGFVALGIAKEVID